MRVFVSAVAESDITGIGDWIAADNPMHAQTFVAELRKAALGLAEMPRRFPLLDRYRHLGIRQRVVGNYLILYHVGETEVEILHILHGARDHESLLDREFSDD